MSAHRPELTFEALAELVSNEVVSSPSNAYHPDGQFFFLANPHSRPVAAVCAQHG